MFFSILYLSIFQYFCEAIGRDYSLYVAKYYDFLDSQSRLTKDLFSQYDSSTSPVYSNINYELPIGYDVLAPPRFNYTLWLYYLKLVEVDEPQEKVTVVLEVMEFWYDPRLVWNISEYGDNDRMYVRQERVWSPTLSAFGVNELVDFRDQDFRYVCLENMGRVSTYMSVKISINCLLDVSQFPFDTQTCQIRFCLPVFHRAEVELLNEIYNGIENKEKISTMGNSEWVMKKLTSRVEQLAYNDSFGSMDQSIFEITFQRNPMYYIYMIVFPSYIINVVSIIGVFMKDADRMSKLNVGLTNIMTMTFILGVMADKVPKTNSIPLLGIYIIINLSFMSLALSFTLYIGRMKKWALPKLKNKKSKTSRAMEKFVSEYMEVTVAIILELLTTANFVMIMSYWIHE